MKKEIRDIILNENYTNQDKLIAIAKLVESKDKDWYFSLSEVFGLSPEMLKAWDLTVEIKKPEKKSKVVTVKDYIDDFYKCYELIYKRKYTMVNRGKDIGQFKNIKMKMDLKQFRAVLNLIHKVHKKGVNHKKSNWDFIIENLSPGIIYSKYNFIMNQLQDLKKNKDGWNW